MSKEKVKFTVECEMEGRWVPHFLAMLKTMQSLGNVGSSRLVGLFADGDGDFHPKFSWDESLNSEAAPVEKSDAGIMYDAG